MNRLERLRLISEKETRLIVGLMTGTSVDGIDAALCRISGHGESSKVDVIAFESFPYPEDIRRMIFAQFRPSLSNVEEICFLDFALGEIFAAVVLEIIERNDLHPADVDLVGTAGQTVWHDPTTNDRAINLTWRDGAIRTRSTLALGQGDVLAQRTGITTLSDLRVRDVAAGGHGAPLIAYADWILLGSDEESRCVQNIGGIANVTWLPKGAATSEIIAFDTGPGNMVIDALAETATGGSSSYDEDGKIAASGEVNIPLLYSLLTDPYFATPPPKTTGRERFGAHYTARLLSIGASLPIEDLLATATALTAKSIAYSYRQYLPVGSAIDRVIVGGGGARNPVLMQMLRAELPDLTIVSHEDVGINSKAKEAVGIAVITNDAAAGLDTNIPGATGGKPTMLGSISL